MLWLLLSRTAYAQDAALTFRSRMADSRHRAEGYTALIFFLVSAVLIFAAGTAVHVVKAKR